MTLAFTVSSDRVILSTFARCAGVRSSGGILPLRICSCAIDSDEARPSRSKVQPTIGISRFLKRWVTMPSSLWVVSTWYHVSDRPHCDHYSRALSSRYLSIARPDLSRGMVKSTFDAFSAVCSPSGPFQGLARRGLAFQPRPDLLHPHSYPHRPAQ